MSLMTALTLTACSNVHMSDAPPRNERCPGGKTQPLELKTVISAARHHRISFYNDPQCADPTVVSQAANILLYGPHTNSQDGDAIQKREGDVTCLLRARPEFSSNVQRIQYRGDKKIEFRLLNLECFIFPDPQSRHTQLRRLSEALNDLRDTANRESG
jgi:hypothetical protein